MKITILALHGVATGGPEATHQLSDELIAQGFDARLVYFRWEDFARGIPAEFPERASFAPEYDRYQVTLARTLPDDEDSVIVLPETAAMLAPAFKRAKVLVWWLSVDNAFGALAGLNLNWLRRPNVFHVSQSLYAKRFCAALGVAHLGMLSDYTVDLREYADPLPMAERPKVAAFNARSDKVIADLPAIGEAIAAIDPEIKCVAVASMSRAEIAAMFAAARVYVDLGNFPGKDRLPREARSMGCFPVCVRAGAGEETASFSISATATPQQIGAVTVDAVRGNCFLMLEPPSPSRERETFSREVRDVFSRFL